MTISIEFSKWF